MEEEIRINASWKTPQEHFQDDSNAVISTLVNVFWDMRENQGQVPPQQFVGGRKEPGSGSKEPGSGGSGGDPAGSWVVISAVALLQDMTFGKPLCLSGPQFPQL